MTHNFKPGDLFTHIEFHGMVGIVSRINEEFVHCTYVMHDRGAVSSVNLDGCWRAERLIPLAPVVEVEEVYQHGD